MEEGPGDSKRGNTPSLEEDTDRTPLWYRLFAEPLDRDGGAPADPSFDCADDPCH